MLRDQINAKMLRIAAIFCLCLTGAAVSSQQSFAAQKPAAKAGQSNPGVERGGYIVESVAVCSQCHSAHDSQGRLEKSHWLEGAPVWLQSAQPVQNWPLQAPRIAGSLPGTDEEMITLLTTGIWTQTGTYLRPPMPQFRMSQEDARAVVAYLKSIKPDPK